MITIRTKYYTLEREELHESWQTLDRLHHAADIVAELTEELQSGVIEWTITDGAKLIDHGIIIGG